MQQVKPTSIRWLFITILGCFLLTSNVVWGNAQFKKAIKHYKDFEIKQAVSILKTMQADSSLSKDMKSKVSLYLGLSYAYLRKKDEAKSALTQALKLNPSLTLPSGTPGRLQRLFGEVKQEAGGGTTPSVTTTPNRQPPPNRQMNFGNPQTAPPARQPDTTAPPARQPDTTAPPARRMSFGMGFSIRKRPPPRRVDPPVKQPDFPPARRSETFPPVRRREAFPPVRRVEVFPRKEPPKRRVALTDPDAASLFGKKKTSKKSGGQAFSVLAWISTGTAVALVAGGAGFGVFAGSIIGQIKPNTVQIDIPRAQEDAERFATIANVLYVSAGAVAISAVLFFVLSGQKTKPRASASTKGRMPKFIPPVPTQPNDETAPRYVRFDSLSQ